MTKKMVTSVSVAILRGPSPLSAVAPSLLYTKSVFLLFLGGNQVERVAFAWIVLPGDPSSPGGITDSGEWKVKEYKLSPNDKKNRIRSGFSVRHPWGFSFCLFTM